MKRYRRLLETSKSLLLFVVLAISIMLFFINCNGNKVIKIGYSGCLTGINSDLGISGRDGILLGVEEINARGGVDGRQIKLIVKDDRNDSKHAVDVDKELVDEGVVAIIGHMTSGITLAVYDMLMDSGILLLSPTASSEAFTGKDDNFFRITTPVSHTALHTAQAMYKSDGLEKIVILYDVSNKAYSQSMLEAFVDEFKGLGGSIVSTLPFSSNDGTSLKEIAEEANRQECDALFIIANGMHTALLCQHLRLSGSKEPIYISGWAKTNVFLQNGGEAIEGVHVSHIIDPNSTAQKYLDFKKRFSERFNRQPNFAAVYSYEALTSLTSCLSNDTTTQAIKKCLLESDKLYGLQSDFAFDRFGDPHRKNLWFTVHQGSFERVE